jgi:hypothetical protein
MKIKTMSSMEGAQEILETNLVVEGPWQVSFVSLIMVRIGEFNSL